MTADTKWGWVSVASVAAAGLVLAPWRLLSTDAYLALTCGREIVEHGLPHTDTLTAATLGHVWTDQQWLGQLAIYGADRLVGLRGAIVLQAILTACAFAMCARYALRRGATPAATLVCGVAGFGLGAVFFTLRPQMFSVLGFAALLVLLGEDVRVRSVRVWWTIPILAIWANLHGVVVLGAMFVGLRAVIDLARKKIMRGLVLGALAALAPLCSPYAFALPRYFRDIGHLQDPIRQLPILEWNRVQWPSDWPFFAIFAVMLVVIVIVHRKKLSRPNAFETLVLAIMGLASWQASRHLQWFGLALAAYAPLALDAMSPIREGRVLARVASLGRVLGPIAFIVLVARLFVMKDEVLEREYPRGVLPVITKLAADHPDSRVVASDFFADWMLWYVPALRGRVEFDVRFELLGDEQARAMGTFLFAKPGWPLLYPDAEIILVARTPHKTLDEKLAATPGVTVVWQDAVGRLFTR